MKSRHVLVMVGALAMGLSSPMAIAMGNDTTNTYFNSIRPLTTGTTILEGSQTTQGSVLIEQTNSSPVVIERTLSSPVIVDKTYSSPVVIEDRIVKAKHMFKIGIWPLFDFEIL